MKGDDIADRLLELSAEVLLVVGELPTNGVGKHAARQLSRAGTSGGANYEEARAAESRADFAHEALVAAKEIGESVSWLRLVQRAALARGERLALAIREGAELAAILKASARTARARAASSA